MKLHSAMQSVESVIWPSGIQALGACKVVNAASSMETEEALPQSECPGDIDRDADAFLPPQSPVVLLAASMLTCILPIPFIFTNGPLWAAQRLLPPMRAAGWIALALNAAALTLCWVSKPLRTPIGVLTYRLTYLYGGIAWLSGLVVTYLLWGVGAVIAGTVCLGGGVVTTGLLAALVRGEWRGFAPLLAFVVLTFTARAVGLRLARHGARYRA